MPYPHRRIQSTQDETGQTLTEYSILLSFIAAVVVAAVMLIGGSLGGIYSTVASAI